MAKAYWIGHVDVEDMEKYQSYVEANASPFAEFGARFLVRGGSQEPQEGKLRARTVVIEFKDIETARACYASPAYQRAKALRDPVAQADLIIIEGYDGAQP
ncbi:DUF1330 domain-containing protein [Epibacterium ulvae]|uniref:DUF1330 domain-containing protein n=1 Tax=Epibacterium ulvae TaxID=1156985 RepID=UPI00248FD6C0|nr:DUF1330 domain-containing protein [Epibacterium ulvae]